MAGKQTEKRAKREAATEEAYASGLFSAFDSQELMTRLAGIGLGQSAMPEKPKDCQVKARYWSTANGFISTVLLIRLAHYDYGFKLKAVDATQQEEVDKWSEENEARILQYRSSAWQEFLIQDACICVWRDSGKPVVYGVEKCEYSDQFGEEILTIKHSLTGEQIDAMKGLSAAERTALKSSKELKISKENALGKIFHFDVVKRAPAGDGLGYPQMRPVFTALAQMESLEVGDNLLAGVGRDVIVHLKIGHEIKNGPHAGSKIHFCTEAKAKNAAAQLKGKKGVMFIATNFDQSFEYPRPDPKSFDPKRYDGVVNRLKLWAMPLAQMILERALNPYLMQVFKQQAGMDRGLMAGHLNTVINSALQPPTPVRCTWSNRCFSDSRLFSELLKFAYQSGSLSQQTVREEAGYENDKELARKKKEAELPDGQKQPAYDPAHSKPEKTSGRKPGSSDNP